MAEEVVKTVENVDTLFPEIVVNGQSHVSDRYVAPEPAQSNPPATQQEEETQSPQPQAVTQGQYIDKVQLNSVQHSLKDSPLAQEVSALQELLSTIQTRLNQIGSLIPSTASAENQLADKNFVNSSIATNTANFLGTYSSLAEIEAIPNPTNNDYAFLETEDASGNNVYDRYKYSEEDEEWLFEYELNNSSFTAEQWATINSGITQVSDTVQSGDTNPVESNAVYEALQNVATEMEVYDDIQDVVEDLPNLQDGQFVATKDTGDELAQPVNVVESGNLHAVTSNAVAEVSIVERSVSINDNYVKFGNGLIIQWGKITTGSNGQGTINFPIEFAGTDYSLNFTPIFLSSPLTNAWGIKTGYTKSSAIIKLNQSYALECFWVAIGY